MKWLKKKKKEPQSKKSITPSFRIKDSFSTASAIESPAMTNVIDLTKYTKEDLKLPMEELANLPPSHRKEDDKKETTVLGPRDIPVFVYGSLRPGFGNSHKMKGSLLNKENAYTKNKFCMISFGTFPALITSKYVTKNYETTPSFLARSVSLFKQIEGDVYFVSKETLASLDILEANGRFYQRELIEVEGFKEKVWCYFLLKSYIPLKDLLSKYCYSDHESWFYSWRDHAYFIASSKKAK